MANYINQLLVYAAGKNRKIGAADNIEIGGGFTAANVNGDGAGLTNLQSSALTGALPALDGSALTSLNGSSIASGTVSAAYLPGTIAYTDAASTTFTNGVTAASFTGDGSALTALSAGELVGALPALDGALLTNLDADNISSGTVADARLSANVAKYNDAAPTFDHTVSAAAFSGSGASLTSLNASNISSGTLADGHLSANVPLLNAGSNTFTGSITASSFSGSGSSLTGLSASNISSGTLGDGYLSANVALYDAAAPTFTNTVSAAAFSGDGSALTSLNAGNITTGTLADGQLSANVALYDAAAPTFTNTVAAAAFSGDGSALTNLDASNISAGTIGDAYLSANVALLNAASNAFTGDLSIGGDLTVTGNVYAKEATSVVIGDNFLDLNAGNTVTGSASAGGLSVSVQAQGTAFTGTDFVAGVASVSNPYITVSADPTGDFAAGDLIQVSGSTDGKNDGQFVVQSVSASPNRITVKGVGTAGIPAYTPFAHTQFVAQSGATATVTKAIFSVIAASNGTMADTNSTAVPAGRWCQAKGSTAAEFLNSWIPCDPSSGATLQSAYNNSASPAKIEMTAAKGGFTLMPAAGQAVGFSLQASEESEIDATGFRFDIKSSWLRSISNKVTFQNAVGIEKSTGAVATGTICYIDSSDATVASDQASGTDAALEVDGVVVDGVTLATVAGTKVVVLYSGSAPVVGDVVYLAGGANAGTCQTALPTSGRVTKLGKCVVNGSAGSCTIVWAPQYIADL